MKIVIACQAASLYGPITYSVTESYSISSRFRIGGCHRQGAGGESVYLAGGGVFTGQCIQNFAYIFSYWPDVAPGEICSRILTSPISKSTILVSNRFFMC